MKTSENAVWVEMSLDELASNPKNPRVIEDVNFRRLRRSVRQFGLVENLVWNRRFSRLVGGHQRAKALRALGQTKAMVCVVDLDEEDEAALMVHLNNPHAQGEFSDALEPLLRELQDFAGFESLGLDELAAFEDEDGVGSGSGTEDHTTEAEALTYSVIVDCAREEDQAKLLVELEDRGFSCRLLIS